MALQDLIDTIVIVMMENRSFDHVLGHLSYDRVNEQVEGLHSPLKQEEYENLFETVLYYPWKDKDRPLAFDPPHEFDSVAAQLGPLKSGAYAMTGFVKAHTLARRDAAVRGGMTPKQAKTAIVPGPRPECMGFLDGYQVPISAFLALNFTVCDHWHAPLPTSTQPNRTMALCGSTRIGDTKGRLIPADTTILDWLQDAGVRWRVYHDGLSFFALYSSQWGHVLGDQFRGFEALLRDFVNEGAATFPQVVIVEPSYASAPHIGSDRPNDNHPPVPMGFGEDFLRDVYDAITANHARWARTAMFLTYDEHGGFYDHVSPPLIPYTVRDGGVAVRKFDSMGVRVPAMVVSPLATLGGVVHDRFDHTSILQLLAEFFTPGQPYSPDVAARAQQGVVSAAAALPLSAPRTDLPRPPLAPIPAVSSLATRTAPRDTMQEAFEQAALAMIAKEPDEVAKRYPDLIHWQVAIAGAGPH